MSATSERPVRFYTRARKFPRLIGKTYDGRTLPGGPYTVQQLVGALITFFVCVKTSTLWSSSGVMTIVITLGATVGVSVLLRSMPRVSRNPVSDVAGITRVLTNPQHGRVADRPLRLATAHRVKGMAYIDQRDLPPLPTPPAAPPTLPTQRQLMEIPSPVPAEVRHNVEAPPALAMTRVSSLLARSLDAGPANTPSKNRAGEDHDG